MRWASRTTPPTCRTSRRARVEYLRALGHPYRELRDRDGIEFAVVGVDLRYHAPLRFDDAFTVSCALVERGARDVQPRLPRRARRTARARAAARGTRCSTARRALRGACRSGWRPSRSRSRRVRACLDDSIPCSPPSRPSCSHCRPAPSPPPSPCRSTLAGVLFNGKENAKVTLKLGGSLRFVWKDGFHNVLTSEGAREGQQGQQRRADGRAQADRLQAHEEGQVRLLLRAPQGARHGADADREVGDPAAAAHQLRPPSVETSSSPSGATAYQMRSLRGSEATIVARGPLRCQVAP